MSLLHAPARDTKMVGSWRPRRKEVPELPMIQGAVLAREFEFSLSGRPSPLHGSVERGGVTKGGVETFTRTASKQSRITLECTPKKCPNPPIVKPPFSLKSPELAGDRPELRDLRLPRKC